ncbi:MAG: sulfatase-like hydrolase/transferase [Acidobacteriota bacterium]
MAPVWLCYAKDRPNLLLVTIDTIRADHLGCYGYAAARTPVLDQLAREGIRFEKAFSAVPLTLPSHATILTGTYPTYHGIHDNSGYVLSPQRTTLAEVLKKAGYATGAFVGAFVLDSKFGLDQGFDRYYDDFDLSDSENVSPGYIQHRGDQVVREALLWLKGLKSQPFFAWVHLYDPHDPYTPPQPFLSRHRGRPYDGEIEFTDSNLGTLLTWLREQGLDQKTLVAVVGDHGESLGQHGEEKHGFFAYNATLRVPMILRLPGGSQAGRVVRVPVGTLDLFPTLLQVLRVDRTSSPEVQGKGLLSLLMGKNPPRTAGLYAECFYPNRQFGWSPLRALIRGSFKYILAPTPELYDLDSDFDERHNLASSKRVLANRLRQNLEELTARFSRVETAAQAESGIDAETAARLRSLGYIASSSGGAQSADLGSLPDPKDQIVLYNKILGLFQQSAEGAYRSVIPEYQAILSSQPQLKIVRYKLGQAYFHSGDYPAALGEFKRVVELAGEDALAIFDLAQTYLRLNRVEEAMAGFRRTLNIDPQHYRARTNLGVLYRREGRVPEAIAELEQARAIAPGSIFVLNNLGIAYSQAHQFDKSLETLTAAVGLAPQNAVVHANLAQLYRQMGRPEEARKHFEIARRLNPRLMKRR